MSLIHHYSPPIGLDISDHSLKLVALEENKFFKGFRKTSRKKISLASYNQLSVPEGYFEQGQIKRSDKIVQLIQKLIREAKGKRINTKYVISVLPEPKTFIKLIEVPNTAKEEINTAITSEVENHIPFRLEEVYLDWQKISETSDKIKILIGVVPKQIAEDYTKLLTQASLEPLALEIESCAITRALIKVKEDLRGPQIIIDFGASRTGLIFCDQNTILFTTSIPFSIEQITLELIERLRISREEAEKAEIICGLSEDTKCQGVIKEILEATISKTIKKIKDAIAFYQEQFYRAGELKKVIICGGGANLKDLDKLLSERLGIETKVANPLVHISSVSKENNLLSLPSNKIIKKFLRGEKIRSQKLNEIKIPPKEVLSYTTAIGLALRGILVNNLK